MLNCSMSESEDCTDLEGRLRRPEARVDVVLDTDTFNEVDDQFALSYLIRSSERADLQAVYAAPFSNDKVATPKEGMEKSAKEIRKLLTILDKKNLENCVFYGSECYLSGEISPVMSPAALDLAERAMRYSKEKPLYVIAIAAITNIASALLINPEIRDRIVIIWLAGHSFDWIDNYEFNMRQDVAAGRVILGSKAPVVMVPCKGVASAFSISRPEAEYWLRGKNALCDYLTDGLIEYSRRRKLLSTWSKPIWDVTAVGWLLDGKFTEDRLEHSPIPEYDHQWAFNKNRHLIRYVYHINRDALMLDLMNKLTCKQ